MPSKVNGFLTPDGRFFEQEEHAVYEEAKMDLLNTAESAIQITAKHSEVFLDFVEKNAEQVRTFCEAVIALQSFVESTKDVPFKKEEL